MIESLKNWVVRRKPVKLDAEERARIAELRAEVAALPSLDNENPESAAAADWLGNRRRLRELLANDDPRRFLEWDVIQKTMFIANAGFVRRELAELQISPDWQAGWKPALRESPAGCPRRCRWLLSSSGGLIHHAYQIYMTERLLGRKINAFKRIVEFGGGYGGFTRLVQRLGFRGRHVIFDLPEFSALQRYFLRSVNVPLATASRQNGVHCISDLDALAAECAPGEGLFIAYWSISETQVDFRHKILSMVEKLDHFFIAYQEQFGEADNARFFSDWSKAHSEINWSQTPVVSHPGSHYLSGIRPRT